ncbi:helix-turn-helix domain-containing protein [Bacillus toyonensis]|uniref:helix-turn-helix domain-containing protein n=1 Tax=Bacillus toyonensis TaxID=155322 RepID=UPI000BFBB094|nr:helix-turn-helix domain-containing protein [Bacillus toyonensis]PHD33044.1 hypothetical protein COF48_19150 [Bacillus toyonensis]
MKMSLAVYEQTKESIDHAFATKDERLLEKETQFLLSSFVSAIPDTFSESVRYVSLRKTKLKKSHDFFTDNHKTFMNQALEILNEQGIEKSEFKKMKFLFDKWFLTTTDEGYIDYEYNTSELVSAEDAATILEVSKPTIYKYLERGLEYKEINGVKKIPRTVIELWKDPVTSFELQWMYQQKKLRNQTLEDKFEIVQQKINTFEKNFGDTFEVKYGNLTDKEIDALDKAADIFEWKDYVKQKKSLLKMIKAERGSNA